MILRDSSVKVADFGIARLPSTQTLSRRKRWEACTIYRPSRPRRAHRRKVRHIFTGRRDVRNGDRKASLEGDSAIAVAMQHISSIPLMPREINPDIPQGFENIIMRAMNAKLEQRYQSAERLYEDLESFRKNPDYKFDYSDLDFRTGDKAADNACERLKGRTGGLSNTGRGSFDNSDLASVLRDKTGAISKAEYSKHAKKARKVSLLSGILCVLIFLVCAFLYLKNTWFDDMFAEPETTTVPDFVNSNIEDILNNPAYTDIYEIVPTREASDTVAEGYVIEQSPAAGRTVIKSDKKPTVKLVVSSGSEKIYMPNVVNTDYRSAKLNLEKLKLKVAEPEFVTSNDITKDYVISTIPAEGTELSPGDTVYLTVSSGPEITYVTMPDLTGETLDSAKAKLEALNLVLGKVTPVESDAEKDTVTFQNVTPGASVPEHTSVNLNISSGPPPAEETAKPDDAAVVPPDVAYGGESGSEG